MAPATVNPTLKKRASAGKTADCSRRPEILATHDARLQEAGNSGDDDEPDDPNEDEETLSDKEFLDDEPVHDFHRPLSFRPVADDTDDGDELRALAQHYEDEAAREVAREVASPAASAPSSTASAMPLAAGTWIRYRNRLSFVVSSKEVLQVVDGKIKEVAVAQELTNATLTVIPPPATTPDPFRQTISPPQLAKATFTGVCPALTAGDRVVIVSGDLKHRTGATYILSIRESLRDNKRVRVAHVSEVDSRQQVTKFDVEIHDRVCVVSGLLHRGLSGRVTDLSDGVWSAQPTGRASLPSTYATLRATCDVEIWFAESTLRVRPRTPKILEQRLAKHKPKTLRLRARDVEFADYRVDVMKRCT
ncbi:hypothetical protein C8F04DRAFT_1200232 [Mycena alexandri]|uniref:Uncharacterized protein n=1 Tax=Mycena alexandri TaxID=1745969 RepID=A0AAD6RYS0_9AGAR|nr:hypothetical protein C8F04DRAFT_1200232 [Mycena alexandri]